jgi:hypothetical protein
MRQPSEENDRYNNSSGAVWAKLLRVFQNHPIYATTPYRYIENVVKGLAYSKLTRDTSK